MKRVVTICLLAVLFGVGSANASSYSVTATGEIIQIFGTFDNSVQIGTPYTYKFNWDTSLPSVGIADEGIYLRQTWDGSGAIYSATVTFGNYSSSGDTTSNSQVSKQDNINPLYGVPDLILHNSTGGQYTGAFSYSGTVYTQIERGGFSSNDPFTDIQAHPATDWTLTPTNPDFCGFFWRLIGGPNGDELNSRVYGNLVSMTYTETPEPCSIVLLGLGGLLLKRRKK